MSDKLFKDYYNEKTEAVSVPTGGKVLLQSGTDEPEKIDVSLLTQSGGYIGTSQELKERTPVCVLDFGAVGDGITDDTLSIQNALNSSDYVYFPEPSVSYKVSQISLLANQTIFGSGQFSKGIEGDGTPNTILIGDGTGAIRQNTILDLNIKNTNSCIYANIAPNLIIERCSIRATGGHALTLFLTYRATIQKCFIGCSGSFDAVRGLDNINGLTISQNTISGGGLGRAINLGRCQSVIIDGNIIESSLNGIWIASTNDVGAGICNGVSIRSNYLEQVSTPFVLGKVFLIRGLEMTANYVGNTNQNIIPTRTSFVLIGRIINGNISNNQFYTAVDGTENVYDFFIDSATYDTEKLNINSNYVQGTYANYFLKSGSFATNISVNARIGALNYFEFCNDFESLGSDKIKDFLSPYIDSSELTASSPIYSLFESSNIDFGGKVYSVEIIDYNGGSLTDVELRIGTNSSGANTILTELDTLTYLGGHSIVPLITETPSIRNSEDFVYRLRLSGVGSPVGKFRIKIRYKLN
tara:strand:+ start:670 stop:2247 length:1578 start_codon:yes stop_codon:yes gene_type:complete